MNHAAPVVRCRITCFPHGNRDASAHGDLLRPSRYTGGARCGRLLSSVYRDLFVPHRKLAAGSEKPSLDFSFLQQQVRQYVSLSFRTTYNQLPPELESGRK